MRSCLGGLMRCIPAAQTARARRFRRGCRAGAGGSWDLSTRMCVPLQVLVIIIASGLSDYFTPSILTALLS